jgi:hypothetical protein
VPALLEDFEGLEQALTAEIADMEALEPRTLAEAKRRPDWPLWEKAIEEELSTLKAAGTWRMEEAPPGANIIGSKWVFKAKKDMAGNIARYKAWLVTQGFSQISGVDYNDTYAPVARLASSCWRIASGSSSTRLTSRARTSMASSTTMRCCTCSTRLATSPPMPPRASST